MEIYINDDYLITSDSLNYMLQKRGIAEKGDKVGSETFRTLGYYSTLESLFGDLINKHIRESKCKNFAEVIDEIKLLKRDIHRVLKPLEGINIKSK